MLQLGLLAPFIGLLNGPVFSIIDKLIPDPALKAKLKAEITSKVLSHKSEIIRAQRDIVLAEITTDSRLTRSWRPVLMYLIILFMVIYGLILPACDLWFGAPVNFQPRWQEIPQGLWDLLKFGLGGYVGGRSLEKISTTLAQRSDNRQKPANILRRVTNFRSTF